MFPFKNRSFFLWTNWLKKIFLLSLTIVLLFTFIGIATTSLPNRLSSSLFSSWTSSLEKHFFTSLLQMENRGIEFVPTIEYVQLSWPKTALHLVTNIHLNDFKSLLHHELPGFSSYDNRIIIAGSGMEDYMPLTYESGPPLEDILADKEAVDPKIDKQEEQLEEAPMMTEEEVVFLYNSHNRESFLPHLPQETNPDRAYHKSVNIMKVSDAIAQSLENFGIRALVDQTDIMAILQEKEWKYWKSYEASRPVVKEALQENNTVQYTFDIHRDSLPRDKTTTTIDGEDVAQILFIIGGENKDYEKNLTLATKLHYILEENYAGVSKGVVTKAGAGMDGVYNQDLLSNALLVEIGGYENTLEEMYRTAHMLAESFSTLYWEAEKVMKVEDK